MKQTSDAHGIFKIFFFSSCTSALLLTEPLYKGQCWRPAFSKLPETEQGEMWQGSAGGPNWHPRASNWHPRARGLRMRPTHEAQAGAMANRAALRRRAENPNLREGSACTQPNESKRQRHHTRPSRA